jgi:hypothetical protein
MDKENKDKNIREEGQGRLSPVSGDKGDINTRESQRDISEIDQQEGNMQHGELGGNFKLENKNHGK